MKKAKWSSIFFLVLLVSFIYKLKAENMTKIKFNLGQNIHETAKHSGAPSFATRDVAGLISYKLVDLPSDIPATYQYKGYEITALPLFGLTLYADKESNNNLAVDVASLQFRTDEIKTHDSAKTFIENLIMQFQQGKWVRYIDELCPAVTGRSSFLNEAGEREQIMGCGLDPAYRLSMDDWISLMAMTQYYEWMGNGVLATLTIRFSNDIHGITYDVGLEFEDFSVKKRRENALALYNLSNGGATLEKITAQRAQDLRDVKLRIKALEENAVRRGDSMVSR